LVHLLGTNCLAQEEDPSLACGKALATDARFSLIATKMPLAGLENITLEMLADESKPTDAERKQLAGYVLARNDCLNAGAEFRKTHYPVEVIAAMLEANDKILDMTAELYNRKITFGASNKQLQSIVSDLRTQPDLTAA
jgi:pyruvate kinase